MNNTQKKRDRARRNRIMRVRKKVRGTEGKPRLSVSKTNAHLYAQIIDDVQGVTLVGLGTLSKEMQSSQMKGKSKEAARHIGKTIGEMAKAKNITTVVFDRGRYKFHGVVAEIAAGAREAGLQF